VASKNKLLYLIILISSACTKQMQSATCVFENNVYHIDTQGFSLSIPIDPDLNGAQHYFLRSSTSKMSGNLNGIIYVEDTYGLTLTVPGVPRYFSVTDSQCKISLKTLIDFSKRSK
jgi:hypothetical protein